MLIIKPGKSLIREQHIKIREIIFKALALLFSLIVFFIFLETALFVYDYYYDKKISSTQEKIYSQLNSAQTQGNPKMEQNGKNCRWIDMFKSHPYVAYVKKFDGVCFEENINKKGFHGPEYPETKLEKTFTIMITGGSVAEDQMGGDKVTTLETALNKNYKIAGFDNFKVIVGAMAGWRQPNQLIMMALYNHIIHGFISLDGFNEFELIEAPNNRMAGFPADPFVMQGISNTLDVWKYLFARCDGALFRHELNSKFLIQLRSYYYTIEMIRQACRYKALELSTDKSSYMTYFTFSNEYANEEDQKKHNEKIFLMYIRSISAIAKANHIRELYFIQPTPAFKKVLTEEERLAAQDLSYKPLYEKMIRDRLALVSENIPVVSLANIFKDDTERVFRDRIHLNDQGREALEKNIIFSMERQWNIQKK